VQQINGLLAKNWGPTLCSLALLLAGSCILSAQYGETNARTQGFVSKKGVGIEQKLNSSVPLDLVFTDEANHAVPLRTYFGNRPVVLAMVYYDCPGLCGLTLSNLVHSLKQVSLEPANDYNVVIVSFNPAEKPALATAKKAKYAESFGKPSFNAGWHFLTGDQQAIGKLASAIGFRYRWDEPTHQFVHAAGIMVATPAGKLARYFYGIQYAPTDLRLSLVEASADKIGSPVDSILLFCCPYDPLTGKYTLTIYTVLKLAGGITLLCLLGFILLLTRAGKKRNEYALSKEATVSH
jgi:protein SCO1/2